MMISPSLKRWLRIATLTALPLLREVTLLTLERWARRQRERLPTGEDPPWDTGGGEQVLTRSGSRDGCASFDDDHGSMADEVEKIVGKRHHEDNRREWESKVKRDENAGTGDEAYVGEFARRVSQPDNLRRAWQRIRTRAKTTPGSDGQSVAYVAARLESELEEISADLASAKYQPRPLRCFRKKKGGGRYREIGIPTVRDRIAQTAMRQILDLHVDAGLTPWSFAYRNGKGCHAALEEVDNLIAAGHKWVVRADVADCFDRIPHELLLAELSIRCGTGSDSSLSDLVRAVITGPRRFGRHLTFPQCGVPQGSPLSPLLANLFLDPVDRRLRGAGYACLRYADDVLIATPGSEEAHEALHLLGSELRSRGLELNPAKSRVVSIDDEEGFEFLGHLYQGGSWAPMPEKVEKIHAKISAHLRETGRKGKVHAAEALRGWTAYYGARGGGVPDRLARWIRSESRDGSSADLRRGGQPGNPEGED